MRKLDGSRRVGWMDASRGLIIGIIAIYHTAQILPHTTTGYYSVTQTIYYWISIGMSLFFLIAGMNSRKYLHGTWKLAWRRRIGPLFWLLTIWVPIYWLAYDVVLRRSNISVSSPLLDLLHGFIVPTWELWFLWSLSFYCLISKLLASYSSRILVAGLGAISFLGICTSDYHLRMLGFTWIADSYTWRSFVSYYFFFYCGHRYTSQILKLTV
ncbi:MAG: hypothetical protein EOO61_22325, partial [Hymenobacter sp.]